MAEEKVKINSTQVYSLQKTVNKFTYFVALLHMSCIYVIAHELAAVERKEGCSQGGDIWHIAIW